VGVTDGGSSKDGTQAVFFSGLVLPYGAKAFVLVQGLRIQGEHLPRAGADVYGAVGRGDGGPTFGYANDVSPGAARQNNRHQREGRQQRNET
jgi:hypothetical protein